MCSAEPTRIFVVEDLPTMRERIREFVEEIGGTRVVGEAESPDAAIEGISRLHPDCVLLDYRLTGGTALDVLRGLRERASDVVCIVLTSHDTPQHRRACLDAGARYFLDKATEFLQVRDIINAMKSSSINNDPTTGGENGRCSAC
jgi:DNA-binding NarL/FixJ family response regulator